MDSSKLTNWRILTNNIDYEVTLTALDADLSEALIIAPNSIQIVFDICNLSDSNIAAGQSGTIAITNSYGPITYMAPDETTSSNALVFESNSFQNSEFIFPDPAVYLGASNGLFNDCTDNDFSNSTFNHTGSPEGSANFGFKPAMESGIISRNNFSNCNFKSISLTDQEATTGTIELNTFDGSIFSGIFDIVFSVDAVTVNTNTFRNCVFQNDSIPFNAGIAIHILGFDFSGSKFTSISLNLTEALIEGCQFFNCTGYDGAEYVPLTSEIIVSMAQRIGRIYDFQLNGKTYTVPAA
jgi:hypothetical protein